MTEDLARWVDRQLEASDLEDDVALLILAALEGDEALRDYLDDRKGPERPVREEPGVREPGGTFLSTLTVEGFRGIGSPAEVSLSPRPGLTIIAGRNGSGKSSLSEALEFVLTGDTYRWNKSSVEWRRAWRNLHHEHARVEVGLVEEDSGPVKVTAAWADDETSVDNATIKTQRAGAKQTDGLTELGWSKALEQYRPILSYDELGGLLEGGRAQLYDALTSILGVDQLSDALKRIHVQLQERKKPGTELAGRRRQLAARADAIDDERATEAKKLLSKTSPDVCTLRALATGSITTETGPVAALRRLVTMPDPHTPAEVEHAITLLRAAIAGLADAKDEVSERSMARLELLEAAMSVHKTHGDMQCPVCRTGALDDEWRATSSELVAQQRKDYDDVRRARQDLTVALSAARRLLTPPSAHLSSAPVPGLDDVVRRARQAWDDWADAPSGSDAATASALADHLSTHAEVTTALGEARAATGARLAELDDVWQPFASQVAAWCDAWDAWLRNKPLVDQLTAAHQWLKENDLRLKNERLAPIEGRARSAWARLRQESNVDIGNLTLTGSGNQRRVVIDASVDGTQVQGFTVLSQGELHALALSLFLPRATMADSPFRFLVLDDPVQAMDPAKVDGLVELLSDLAQTRQVIVLSHDDRLAAAVRRADVDATVLEVTRASASRVNVTVATDPAARYLADAFALIRETEEGRLPDGVMRRTLPGLLRFAVEAVARDTFFSSRLGAGMPLAEVEDAWTSVSTTRERVGLAVFGEARANHELEQWAAAPYRKFGLRNIGSAMHAGLKAELDARDAVRDVEKLIVDLRSTS